MPEIYEPHQVEMKTFEPSVVAMLIICAGACLPDTLRTHPPQVSLPNRKWQKEHRRNVIRKMHSCLSPEYTAEPGSSCWARFRRQASGALTLVLFNAGSSIEARITMSTSILIVVKPIFMLFSFLQMPEIALLAYYI